MVLSETTARWSEPIMLVGSERSGTTLLRLMLDSHPQIAFHEEFEFVTALLRECPLGTWPEITDFHDYLRRNRIFRLIGHSIDESLDYPSLARSFLRQKIEQRGGKSVCGATVHHDFDQLPRIWPNARYVHIVRDGRDVARSVVQMGWEGHVYEAAQVWLTAERSWDRLVAGLSADQWMEVRFEDLVEDQQRELQRICDFAGVDYCREMMDYVRGSSYAAPDVRMASKWCQQMAPGELRLVESRIGEMLRRRGYETSTRHHRDPGRIVRSSLRLRSRIGRFRFRCRRYGMGLVMQDALVRRVGSQRRQDAIERQLQAIDNLHVK